MIVWLIGIAILVLQRDLGTSLLFFSLFVAMLYVATNRVSGCSSVSRLFAPPSPLAVRFFSHVRNALQRQPHAFEPEFYYGGSLPKLLGCFRPSASGGLSGYRMGTRISDQVPLANSIFILSSWPRSWASPAWLRS